MSKFLDAAGLAYFWQRIRNLLNGKVDKASGKGLSTNDYTTAEQTKLAGIAAEANKYAHPAYTAAKSGLYKVTVDAQGHVSATAAVAKADITALGIPDQETMYTLPVATASQLGGVKIGANLSVASGVISAPAMTAATDSAAGKAGVVPAPAAGSQAKFLRGDGTWAVPSGSAYSTATASQNGLMSSEDKKKLDAFGAASTYALKADIASVYRYKGSVASASKLPASPGTGDVYNLEDTGMNCAWTGAKWDELGAAFTITAMSDANIDSIVAQ